MKILGSLAKSILFHGKAMNRNSSTSFGKYEYDFYGEFDGKKAFPPHEHYHPSEISTKSMDLQQPKLIRKDFQVHRKISRQLAKLIPKDCKKGLLKERNALVRKKFVGNGLAKSEERRLALLRWEIERIEEAEIGPDLDELEKKIEGQEMKSKGKFGH